MIGMEYFEQQISPGTPVTFPGGGDSLTIVDLSAGKAVDVIYLDQYGRQIGTAKGMGAGFSGAPGRFGAVQISSPVTQTVSLVVTSGNFTVTRIAGSVSVNANSGFNGLSPLTFDGLTGQTVAASGSRKELHIMADNGNAGTVYVGSSDGSAGIPLAAGQSYIIASAGSVSLFGVTAGDKVHLAEVVE